MKIAHILEGFTGGTCTYMCCVLPRLVDQGFEVTLIGSLGRHCPEAWERISHLRRYGVKVELIPMSRQISVLGDARSFVALVRLLLRGHFDIVHTHCSKAGALGRVAALVAGIRVRVHSPHCFAFLRTGGPIRRRSYLAMERLLGRFTTHLAAIGELEAQVAISRRIVPRGRCTPTINGLPDSPESVGPVSPAARETVRRFCGVPPGAHVVLTVCRLVDYKGVPRFLEAARISKTDKTVFLVAGDGELREQALRFIREHRLDHRIRLLGYVSDMQPVYAISDIVALCSDAEAMPYVLLEAMRVRCPIVATRVPGMRELIVHGRTGCLVEPQPHEIADTIDELLADARRRDDLAQHAYDFFRAHHTLGQQITQLTRVYRTIV